MQVGQKLIKKVPEQLLFKNAVGFIKDIAAIYSDKQLSFLAGAISFFTFFSIFPLLLLLAIAVDAIFGANAFIMLLRIIDAQLPLIGALVSQNITDVLLKRPHAGIIAVAGLLWGSLGIFYSIEFSLNHIFAAGKTKTVIQTLVGYLITILLSGPLFILSLLAGIIALNATLIFNIFNLDISGVISSRVLIFVLSVVFSMGSALVAYMAIPSVRLPVGQVFIGAAFTGTAFETLNLAFGFYVRFADLTRTYGGLAPFATFLLWLYFSAIIFLLGAILARMFAKTV